MFSVIIVDDEYKICQLIQNSIDWNTLGFQVIALAQSGTDALQLISEYKPDVVITDIRMPGITGIELIEKGQEVSPNTEYIIISGHKDFEYAHHAMKFNVEHYLLKPLEEKELVNALLKISKKFVSRMDFISQQNQIKMELSQSKASLQRNFFSALLYRPSSFSQTLDGENQSVLSTFPEGNAYKVLIIKCDEDIPLFHREQNIILFKKIMDYFPQNNCETNNFYEIISDITSYDLTCILNFQPEREAMCDELINEIFDKSCGISAGFPSSSITIGISKAVSQIVQLPCAFQDAVLAVKSRVLLGTGRIITSEFLSDRTKSLCPTSFIDNINNLEHYIETYNYEEIEKWFSVLQKKIEGEPSLDIHILNSLCKQIIHRFLYAYLETNDTVEDQNTLNDKLNMGVYHCKTISEIIHFLSGSIIRIIDELYNQKKSGRSKTISDAKNYMLQHYSTSLKLEDVANSVGFNPSYFSVLFKQEAGKSFSDYLLEIRIKEAKCLLRETRNNVSEIANMVGYNDVKHFVKLFKQEVGVTPSRYRKLY